MCSTVGLLREGPVYSSFSKALAKVAFVGDKIVSRSGVTVPYGNKREGGGQVGLNEEALNIWKILCVCH